jgi:hypothetical protein
MYIETSFPQKENDKARLISPQYDIASGGSCLQFFYHMWGRDTNTLNVLLKDGNDIQGRPLWALKGDQDNLWRPASATIQAAGKFQVKNKTKKKGKLEKLKIYLFRLFSKVSSVQILKVIYPLMIFLFHQIHVLHMVPVHSKKIYVLGHHRIIQMISIGIVYHQHKSVYFIMVQIILKVIQQ